MTVLEAANRVMNHFVEGEFVKIISIEGDELHIKIARIINSISCRENEKYLC